MFSRIYEIKYSDIDINGFLKLPVLLGYLEDAAAKNADFLNFGYKQITDKNLGWFLLKYAIEFYQYPKNVFTIKIATEPRGSQRLFTHRDFYIYDENDNLLGRVASTWTLIDFSNKSMLNSSSVFPEIVQFSKKEDDLSYEKIPQIAENAITQDFKINYYDIDVNQHVNNVKYVTWAMETLPIEFFTNKEIKRLDINYKKEIAYGNTIHSEASIENNVSIHSIKNKDTNEELCLMKVIFA